MFQRAVAKWRSMESTVLTHLERLLQRTDDARVAWLEGIFYASCGGGLAGLCLVFTKAIVKIMWLPGHPVSRSPGEGVPALSALLASPKLTNLSSFTSPRS